MQNLDLFLEECIKANKEIYQYLNTCISSNDYEYSNKIGYGGDNSLNMDLKAEQIFIKYLSKFGNIYSEEEGFIKGNGSNKITIDPLDGSSNFQIDLEYFGTSVSLEINNEIACSIVCNLCTHTLLYKKKKEKIIKIDLLSQKKIQNFIQNSNIIGIFEKAYNFPKITKKLYENKIKFRNLGAIALSLANARNYSFVLFIGKTREFDTKAALHISEGLYIHKDNNFLLVSKNLTIFNLVKEIIKEELVITP